MNIGELNRQCLELMRKSHWVGILFPFYSRNIYEILPENICKDKQFEIKEMD